MNETWIHWNKTWIWWPEHGSVEMEHGCGEQDMDLLVSFEMEHGSQLLKVQSVCHMFSWSGCNLLGFAACSIWKFIFELTHELLWEFIPGISHCYLCCIQGLNPSAGHFVMVWSSAYVNHGLKEVKAVVNTDPCDGDMAKSNSILFWLDREITTNEGSQIELRLGMVKTLVALNESNRGEMF